MKNVKNKHKTLGIVLLFCLCYFTPLIFVAPNSNTVDIQKESLPKPNALTQVLLHSYDFEGDTVGQDPSGVTLSVIEPAGSGTANVDNLGDAQQNHVAIHKDGGDQRVELRDNISYYGNTFDAGVFHCKIYHDDSLFGILFHDDIGTLFRLDWYDGIIGRWSPQATYTTYNYNQWYDVVVYFNVSLGWMFEIDGVRFGDGYAYPFEHAGSGGMEWIRWCSAFSGGGNGYFRVDDVEFYYYEEMNQDLAVSLEVPSLPDMGESYIVNATVHNNGEVDEINVDLLLYLDNVVVDSINIPSLPIGTSETINYMWIPPDYGFYNFTAYAPPVPGESFTGNNLVTEIINIVDTQLFDGMYTNYTFIYRSGVDEYPGLSHFSYSYISGSVFRGHWWFNIMDNDYNTFYDVDSTTRIMTNMAGDYWLGEGHHDPGWIFTDTNIGDDILIDLLYGEEHLFNVIDELIYDIPSYGLVEVWVLQDLSYPTAIAYYEKSTGILLSGNFIHSSGEFYSLDFVDTNVQFNYVPQDHELRVSLEVPSDPDVGEIYIVNATVFNEGINDEFNVDLFLYLDNVLVDSIPISTLSIGASETINYMWIPPNYGTYNFTAYAPPVVGEPYITNNIATRIRSISLLSNYTVTLGALYTWIDASGGTELLLSDDGFATVDLPFNFQFYNDNFSTIYVGSNGYLSFTDPSPSDYSNDPIPSGDTDNYYLIAPFWDDIYPAYGGNIYVQSFGTYWVAEWLDIFHIGGFLIGSFEVVLYNTGEIRFNYDYLDYTTSGYTCGLNLGMDINYFNSYQGLNDLTDDFSILFTYLLPDTLTVTTPDITSSWETGTLQTINWASTGSISDVKIELFENDVFVMEIVASTPNDGEFPLVIPTTLVDSTVYQIKISDAVSPTASDFSHYFEIFTTVVPDTITVTIPDSVSIWEMGSSHVISWTSTGSIADVKVELYKGGVFLMEIVGNTANDGSFEWTIPTDLEDGIDYQIRVSDVLNPETYGDSPNFAITSVDIPGDGAIPGYNLYILIGSISIVSVILLKNRKKFKN